MLAPRAAIAADGCPPGHWFCEPSQPVQPTGPSESPGPAQAAAPGTPAPAASSPQPSGAKPCAPDDWLCDPPAPASAPSASPRGERMHPLPPVPPPPPPPPRPRRLETPTEWGVNAHLQLGLLPDAGNVKPARETGTIAVNDGDPVMGGLGLSLRFRPLQRVALDLGVDLITGTDATGGERTEVPLSASALIYVNPRSRAQVYFLVGPNLSFAQVSREALVPEYLGPNSALASSSLQMQEFEYDYIYLGGQAGVGLDVRLTRHISLDFALLGVIRSRIDDEPGAEYVDQDTGKSTDTSGAGLFRGGVTFWW